ncbi:MAG TPA: response regulator [Rhizomicrobium sp.]
MTDHPAHILVVDDDAMIQKTLKRCLEQEGHRVSLASNGRQAVAHLEEDRPDIIILDLFMPEMDGFETLRQVHSHAASTRVLAISGGGSSAHCDYLDMASRFGAHGVLRKPFTVAQLVAAVDTLLPDAPAH